MFITRRHLITAGRTPSHFSTYRSARYFHNFHNLFCLALDHPANLSPLVATVFPGFRNRIPLVVVDANEERLFQRKKRNSPRTSPWVAALIVSSHNLAHLAARPCQTSSFFSFEQSHYREYVWWIGGWIGANSRAIEVSRYNQIRGEFSLRQSRFPGRARDVQEHIFERAEGEDAIRLLDLLLSPVLLCAPILVSRICYAVMLFRKTT